MMTEDGGTLGGGHTEQHAVLVLQNCALETCVILLTTVTPMREKDEERTMLFKTLMTQNCKSHN